MIYISKVFFYIIITMKILILPIPTQPLRQYISRNLVQKIVMLPVPVLQTH